ncbi:hypothetical protein EJ06DRAFT_560159 [Trichodelitschia bisporula]|uniref:Uncharacterized protein n=1 Tax=Trichodelitschia bisporula TaxID=703511 RepID=A0A6G1HK32_9PEZI|nr:hypothetical protein EJ06DRAFT_560159 [Trichodelitschia bisporula]
MSALPATSASASASLLPDFSSVDNFNYIFHVDSAVTRIAVHSARTPPSTALISAVIRTPRLASPLNARLPHHLPHTHHKTTDYFITMLILPRTTFSPPPLRRALSLTHHTLMRRDSHSPSGWVMALTAFLVISLIGLLIWGAIILLRRRRGNTSSTPLMPNAPFSTPQTGPFAWLSRLNPRSRSRAQGVGFEPASRRGADDEAWDARVDDPYGGREEQELGLRGPTGYEGAGYVAEGFERPAVVGGSRVEDPFGDENRAVHAEDPFADANAAGRVRGVSPRPVEGGKGSPTERRSLFKENV